MYSTCLFCHGPLGANEVVEHFPVGRRLAFDAAKGRLWVVCPRCAQWNLTPLEERWEAVEECERMYRDARVRASTENVGLARLREGLDLIRVGKPLRPEFAAWRYGERFRRRRRLAWIAGGAGGGILAASVVLTGFMHFPVMWLMGPAYGFVHYRLTRHTEVGRAREVLARALAHATGRKFDAAAARAGANGLIEIRLTPTADEQGWGLRLGGAGKPIDFVGAEALRMAHVLLPATNAQGAGLRALDRAVREIEAVGDPRSYFRETLTRVRKTGLLYTPIAEYKATVRLALEMAAHEEAERRAIEGELAELERAWQEAEEIAAIADDLLLPPAVEDWLQARRRSAAPERDARRGRS